jgi:hypothetical protein
MQLPCSRVWTDNRGKSCFSSLQQGLLFALFSSNAPLADSSGLPRDVCGFLAICRCFHRSEVTRNFDWEEPTTPNAKGCSKIDAKAVRLIQKLLSAHSVHLPWTNYLMTATHPEALCPNPREHLQQQRRCSVKVDFFEGGDLIAFNTAALLGNLRALCFSRSVSRALLTGKFSNQPVATAYPLTTALASLAVGQHLDTFCYVLHWFGSPGRNDRCGRVKLKDLLFPTGGFPLVETEQALRVLRNLSIEAVARMNYAPLLQYRLFDSCSPISSGFMMGSPSKILWLLADGAGEVTGPISLETCGTLLQFYRDHVKLDLQTVARNFGYLPMLRDCLAALRSTALRPTVSSGSPAPMELWRSMCSIVWDCSPSQAAFYPWPRLFKEIILQRIDNAECREEHPPLEDYLTVLCETFSVDATVPGGKGGRSPATAAVEASQIGVLHWMRKVRPMSLLEPDGFRVTPLQRAVELGKRDVIKAMVRDMQVPLPASGLLHLAMSDPKDGRSLTETLGLIDLLLELGADINEVDENTRTVLHLAKDPALATALVARGAQLEAVTTLGETPLALAVEAHRPLVVGALCALGANTNSRTNRGQTPLFIAAKKGNVPILTMLLSHGADPDLSDRSGRTPLTAAIDGNRTLAVKVLLQHEGGGKEPDEGTVEELLRGGLSRLHGSPRR